MTEALSATLENLVRLGKIDAQVLKQTAEKRRLLSVEGDIEKIIGSIKIELSEIERRLEEKQQAHHKEETFLSIERQKLVDRRKSLSSLGDYKLQSAAEREIEHSSRQLAKQEENLAKRVEEIDTLTKLREEKNQIVEQKSAAAEKMLADSMDRLSAIDEELKQLQSKRQQEITGLDRATLQVYQRAFNRNPNDPVVPIKGAACGGCFINLGPQLLSEIANAKVLVTCRSCGRVLHSAVEEPAS